MGTEELEATTPDFAALSLRGPFAKFASNEHRKGVAVRLDALLEKGQCTPAEYKEKETTLKTVRLSLDSAGNHRLTPTESWIDSRESVPEGTFWDDKQRTRMSQLETVPHPSDLSGDEVTDEEADEIVAEINRRK